MMFIAIILHPYVPEQSSKYAFIEHFEIDI